MADHLEIERTFDVPATASMPGLAGGPVDRVSPPVTRRLEAVYLDTEDLALARARTTLRRRTGGDDDGWHLKLPVGPDRRLERHEPLGTLEDVPGALGRAVAVHVRGRVLRPVVRLTTRRDELALLDADGVVLAVVCDDHVDAERLDGSGRTTGWREWEVELVDGGPGVLDRVGKVLAQAGARPATSPSKLARALGDDAPRRPDVVAPTRRSTAGEALASLLRAEVTALQEADPRVREGDAEGVHDLRVATRRLRSLLATWRPVLDRERTEPVRAQLKWLGGVLGEARVTEVQRARLARLFAGEPAELVLGPVAVRADDELSVRFQRARDAVLEALDGDAYTALLDDLDSLALDPPLRGDAARPVLDVLPVLVRRDWTRLRRAVAAVGTDPDALHDVRKAAKRLRYAVEPAVALHGPPARRLRRSAKRVQTVLGHRQDAVDAQVELRRLGVQAHLAGENGFSFGRAHAIEQGRQREAEARFAGAWAGVRPPRTRRWT